MAKSKRKSRATKSRKPITFFQRIGSFFKRIFSAPSADKAEKIRAKAIREIKSHGYSPSYEKRLIRAVERGGAGSLQQARGHKPGEARQRAERERKTQGGLTNREIQAIQNFHKRYDPRGQKPVTANAMVEFTQRAGYKVFQQYRAKWEALRKQYVRQLRDGTYSPMGTDYLSAAGDDIDYDQDFEDIDAHIPDEWFFYH